MSREISNTKNNRSPGHFSTFPLFLPTHHSSTTTSTDQFYQSVVDNQPLCNVLTFKMPSNTPPSARRRRTTRDVDHYSASPTTTPITRKRQRIDYAELHSGRRSATPTSLTPSANSPRRPSRSIAPTVPIQSQPRPRPFPPFERLSTFLPDRQPILDPPQSVIQVSDPSGAQKESKIAKTKWWWAYYTVVILDTKFKKGKKGNGELIYNELYTCRVSPLCGFKRYADKLKSATGALSDHIKDHHHILESQLPDDVLSGKAVESTNMYNIRAWFQPGNITPQFEDALLDWITYTNKPFTITECEWFTRMLHAAGFTGWIPKSTAIRAKLEARVLKVQAQVIQDIKSTASTISLTLDAWTSQNKKSILAINITWLDKSFKRHQHCIEFVEIKGGHSGENLAEIVYTALRQYDICHLLLTITGDNAGNNDTLCVHLLNRLLKEYDDYLDPFPIRGQTIRFRGLASRIRCFAHILNLIVKAILQELGSSTFKQAVEYLDRATVAITNRERSRLQIPNAQGVIAKLRIIVLWVHRSTDRIQDWRALPRSPRLPRYDIDTRWNSTFRMINDAFEVRSAINDSCSNIAALELFKLSNQEWDQLDKIRLILRPFEKFTEYVSREQPSIQMLARMYAEVGVTLRQIIRQEGDFSSIDNSLIRAVQRGKDKFTEYYDILADTDLPYIATILDPRIKTKWIEEHCDKPADVIRRIREFLKATYPLPDAPLPDNTPADIIKTLEYQFLAPYFDRASEETPDYDIDTYLDSPRVRWNGRRTDNQTQWILDWWNANSSQFKCMAQAAQEILAIPASEVDCERLFGEGRDLLGIRRYSMSGETMRVMILLKSALRSLRGLLTVEEVPTNPLVAVPLSNTSDL